MTRHILICASALAAVSCSGPKVVERSAPERPGWAEAAAAARDTLYFVGTCTERPSLQDGLACARGEVLTDVAAWVGARISAYVYSGSTEEARRSSTTVSIHGDFFLTDLRRSDTYYEVREEDWARLYRVSVLYAYPRSAAEAERARIEEATARADALVERVPAEVHRLADAGQLGAALDALLAAATQVAVRRNLNRTQQTALLIALTEELISRVEVVALRHGAAAHDAVAIEAVVTYRGRPAAGVALSCRLGTSGRALVTAENGRALCELPAPPRGRAAVVAVRPDITRYLAALPAEAGNFASAFGRLLDYTTGVEVGSPLEMLVKVGGGAGCEPAMDLLRRKLLAAGARLVDGEAPVQIEVSCTVGASERAGEIFTAPASGNVMLRSEGGTATGETVAVSGLGASGEAARREALERLGDRLGAGALELLSELDRRHEE